jgi:hypothetical protein
LKYKDRSASIPVYATYAAKKTIEYILRGDEFKWTAVDQITTAGELVITAVGMSGRTALEAIMEYEYRRGEDDWQLSDSDCRKFDYFLAAERQEAAEPTAVTEKRAPREKVERAPKPSRDGLVSVGDIAAELDIEPREARGILRSLKLPKPDVGWAWPAAEAAQVKAQIAKEMIA